MRLSENKRMRVTVWSLAAVLVLAVLAVSFNALAQESVDAQDPHQPSPSIAAEDPASAGPASSGGQDAPSGDSSESSASSSAASEVDRALARGKVPEHAPLGGIDSDSAGTVFTFSTPLEDLAVAGDLYWAGIELLLADSRIGNDALIIGREVSLADSDVLNDVRVAGQDVSLENVIVQDYVDVLALDVVIDEGCAATGYYCGGGSISYAGKAKRFIAYGQSIFFDGVVEGDVTLSAQDIVIGPNARVTGTMDIRSGQTVEGLSIPETAEVGRIDTTLNQPNTIDQITQIRAAIAPYFQVGSLLFVVVSFILLGLAFLWGFGHKLTEAHRLIRRYPLAVVVLACIALMLMFVAIMLGTLLVFTIPLSVVVLLVLLICAICCVPFTGASLMLVLRERIRPFLCVTLGSGIAGALLFVPYANIVVFVGSLVYFVGYIVNIAMFGHDKQHDESFHVREADDSVPRGMTSGILPVSAQVGASRDETGEAATGEAGGPSSR